MYWYLLYPLLLQARFLAIQSPKNRLAAGLRPDPLGASAFPQIPYPQKQGPTSNGRGRERREGDRMGGEMREGEGKGGNRKGGEGKGRKGEKGREGEGGRERAP